MRGYLDLPYVIQVASDNTRCPTSIMEARTTLPLDILLYIVDLLAGGDHEDIKSSNPVASLQIHGTAMSQTPLLVSRSRQRIELQALQRFAFKESRHRLLREEPELQNLEPH